MNRFETNNEIIPILHSKNILKLRESYWKTSNIFFCKTILFFQNASYYIISLIFNIYTHKDLQIYSKLKYKIEIVVLIGYKKITYFKILQFL